MAHNVFYVKSYLAGHINVSVATEVAIEFFPWKAGIDMEQTVILWLFNKDVG